MVSEWRDVTIESIATRIAMGPFGSDIKTDNFVPSGVPVIRGGNLTNGRFNGTGFVFLTEEKANDLASANAFPDDIVFTHRGTLGQVGIVPREPFPRYVVSQSQMKLSCDQTQAISEFIYYYFKSPSGQNALLMNTSQTGVPAISRPVTSLKGIRLLLPSLKEQRAIAHILGTLDDKIELNRQQNETLEAMARALFKAWFVDFEPVRAKMEGRWQRGQSLPGLPAHLYDLFPDRLVESELGEIPEGWEITSLSEYCSLNPESWTKRTRPTQIQYVDLSNTKWGRIESITSYESSDAPSRAQRSLRPLDTIVGTVRPGNGSYALIFDEGLTGSTGFAVLRPLKRECSEFVYLAATAPENIERLSNLADGGAYPAVRPEIVSATQVPQIGEELISEFSYRISSMLTGISDNERESRTLAQLRDTLLPKLISGELRVPDVEQFIGRIEVNTNMIGDCHEH